MTKPHNFRPRVTGSGHMLTVATPASWTTQGFCVAPTGMWREANAADYDNDNNRATPETAAELCAGCPVLEQCLEDALSHEGEASARNRYGIRGGMTPAQRADLAAERQPKAS